MANPAYIDGELAVVAVGAALVSIPINVSREYHLYHNGLNVTGGADTSTIFVGANCTRAEVTTQGGLCAALVTDPTADCSAEDNKFILKSGGDVLIGPGYGTLKLIAAGQGAPVVSIAPSGHLFQRW